MPPQLPHPCMPPVAAMLLLCTAHLPVTCPVPPTACHMPCDPIPGSFFNAWRWAHNLCDPNFYPPTEASTATSTDCLYLCDACTLRAMHIILHSDDCILGGGYTEHTKANIQSSDASDMVSICESQTPQRDLSFNGKMGI